MNFIHTHWLGIFIFIVVVIVVVVLSAIIEGYIDGKKRVQNGPREEMFWCHIHGTFRKKHCLPLFPELNGKPVNSFVCPLCYRKAVFTDVDAKLKGN